MAYLDAATDRMLEAARTELLTRAEAARVGTVGAHNPRWYRTWRQGKLRVATPAGRPVGLEGADLERTVYALLHTNPDIVTVRTVAA